MSDNKDLKCKCPSCEKVVYPIINIRDWEQKDDYPWAECPECHFCTGNRPNEMDAFQLFKYLGECVPTNTKDKTFEEFWASIVTNEDGSLNVEQIKKELHDYHNIMEEVSKVYDHITGGMISKINTKHECVILEADQHYDKIYQENEPDWLYQKLKEWCMKHGYDPRNLKDLFEIIHCPNCGTEKP